MSYEPWRKHWPVDLRSDGAHAVQIRGQHATCPLRLATVAPVWRRVVIAEGMRAGGPL